MRKRFPNTFDLHVANESRRCHTPCPGESPVGEFLKCNESKRIDTFNLLTQIDLKILARFISSKLDFI